MDEKTKDLLARVLDMDERELRAALISAVNGFTIEESIDSSYNDQRRLAQKLFRKGVNACR
jgi:hypothetical protein